MTIQTHTACTYLVYMLEWLCWLKWSIIVLTITLDCTLSAFQLTLALLPVLNNDNKFPRYFRRMGKKKASAPSVPRIKHDTCGVNLTRLFNSSSRCCYRVRGHYDCWV